MRAKLSTDASGARQAAEQRTPGILAEAALAEVQAILRETEPTIVVRTIAGPMLTSESVSIPLSARRTDDAGVQQLLAEALDVFVAEAGEQDTRDDDPPDPPDGGVCTECGTGLPSWQQQGVCWSCEDVLRDEAAARADE